HIPCAAASVPSDSRFLASWVQGGCGGVPAYEERGRSPQKVGRKRSRAAQTTPKDTPEFVTNPLNPQEFSPGRAPHASAAGRAFSGWFFSLLFSLIGRFFVSRSCSAVAPERVPQCSVLARSGERLERFRSCAESPRHPWF